MPRAIWRGTISFGMVSIPVKLFSATESQDVTFRQLHAADNSPIRLVRRCAADGQDLEAGDMVRGYEYSKDRYVIITDADLDGLPLPSKQTIDLAAFVQASEIDPMYFEKSYFLEPEEVGRKPFALLVKALDERGLVAVGKLALRSKERLCVLRPRSGHLVLETLYFPAELREPEEPPAAVEVSAAEMNIAYALIDLLTEPFDPTKYRDEYREQLMAVITAKLEGQEIAVAPAPQAARAPVDLMGALRASVEAAKRKKDEAQADQPRSSRPARRRKSPSETR